MKLNHLNLTVPDVANARGFFEKYFGFVCREEKGNNTVVILYGTDNFILTIMSEAFNKNGSNYYPEAFHFGFILESKAQVDIVFALLKEGSISLEREPAKIRNSYGFYFHFQNLMIEVGHYFE